MAHITYTKLGVKPIEDIKTFVLENNAEIEVRQYLPFQEKLAALTDIINSSSDDNGFYNSAKIEFYKDLYLIYNYTNIKFTDKQKEDEVKLYDAFCSNGLLKLIKQYIPYEELEWFDKHLEKTIDKIYEYRNSVYGILDAVKNDYSDLDLDVNKLQEDLSNTENLGLLKEVVDKLV